MQLTEVYLHQAGIQGPPCHRLGINTWWFLMEKDLKVFSICTASVDVGQIQAGVATGQ